MFKKQSITGFTLIELLVVISIMTILIALSAFGLQQARESARDGQRKSDMETIRTGLSFYKADCNIYPTPNSGTTSHLGTNLTSSCGGSNTYIEKMPTDPISSNNYHFDQSGSTYTLCSSLETETGPTPTQCTGANCGSGVYCNYYVVHP